MPIQIDFRFLLTNTVEAAWNHTDKAMTYPYLLEVAVDAQSSAKIVMVEQGAYSRGYTSIWVVMPYIGNDDNEYSVGRFRTWNNGSPKVEFELHAESVSISLALVIATTGAVILEK